MQGGVEANAIKDVIAIYGTSYRSRVYTWFLLARALDQEKRDIIKKHPDFNQSWILDNKFLLGEGVEERYIMNAASLDLAIDLALWVAKHGRLS